MRCENLFCIYWSKENLCSLDEIELDIQGSCSSCIYIDLDSSTLLQIREQQLRRIRGSE